MTRFSSSTTARLLAEVSPSRPKTIDSPPLTTQTDTEAVRAALGRGNPLQTGMCANQQWHQLLDLWSVSSRAGVNLFHQFCYIADFAGISFRTLLVEGRT